ncbi:MAG: winged helix DNA-binding protein [Candidatus Helarchaeota archaeon]
MTKSNLQEFLSIPHLINIIFTCEKEKNLSEIRRTLELSSNTLIYPAIDRLLELGLINETFIRKGGIQRRFSLTEKGKKVLKILNDLKISLEN